jgi:hypothetical protein
MPAAVRFYTWVALSPRSDRKLVVRSENFGEQIDLSLDEMPAKGRDHSSDYVVGVAKMLEDSGFRLPGANLLLEGNVPQGAGLSSSASLEVGYSLLSLDQTPGGPYYARAPVPAGLPDRARKMVLLNIAFRNVIQLCRTIPDSESFLAASELLTLS